MPRPVTVTLSHDLGKEEARRRIAEGFGKLQSSITSGFMMKLSETWTSEDRLSFAGSALGQSVSGVIDVFPAHVRIEVTLPNMLAAVAEIITGKLQKEGTLLLERK